jgi:hypothetical protein
MLTGTTGHNTLPLFFVVKMSHTIVSTSNFERENRLQVLPLQPNLVPELGGEIDSQSKWSLLQIERSTVDLS